MSKLRKPCWPDARQTCSVTSYAIRYNRASSQLFIKQVNCWRHYSSEFIFVLDASFSCCLLKGRRHWSLAFFFKLSAGRSHGSTLEPALPLANDQPAAKGGLGAMPGAVSEPCLSTLGHISLQWQSLTYVLLKLAAATPYEKHPFPKHSASNLAAS